MRPRMRVRSVGLLLPMLLGQILAGLVPIFLRPNRILLLRSDWISRPRVTPLVLWQRRWRNIGTMVPSVPSASLFLPIVTPMFVPMRRRVGTPAAKVGRRTAVVTNGDPQYIHRHILRSDHHPWAVVPTALVPI